MAEGRSTAHYNRFALLRLMEWLKTLWHIPDNSVREKHYRLGAEESAGMCWVYYKKYRRDEVLKCESGGDSLYAEGSIIRILMGYEKVKVTMVAIGRSLDIYEEIIYSTQTLR